MMFDSEENLDDLIYQRIVSLSKYGDKLAESARYGDAIEKYKEALKKLPMPYDRWGAATWIYVAMGDARFMQGDFERSLKCFVNATYCPSGIGNPFIHLRLGQCELELGNTDRATDELMRAYMGGGEEIFREDNIKYLSFIKSRIKK